MGRGGEAVPRVPMVFQGGIPSAGGGVPSVGGDVLELPHTPSCPPPPGEGAADIFRAAESLQPGEGQRHRPLQGLRLLRVRRHQRHRPGTPKTPSWGPQNPPDPPAPGISRAFCAQNAPKICPESQWGDAARLGDAPGGFGDPLPSPSGCPGGAASIISPPQIICFFGGWQAEPGPFKILLWDKRGEHLI